MKVILLLTLLITLNLNAQNLTEILDALKESTKFKLINEKTKADIAENELTSSYQAPELGFSLSHAEDSVEDGLEYSIGFSQTLSHPFSSASKDRGVNSLSNAIKENSKYQQRMLELEVASRYHKACISKEIKDKANLLFDEQSKRFFQFEKAYELGEISRKNLLFNKLDLVKLNKIVNSYNNKYLVEFLDLKEALGRYKIDSLSCDDLFDITRYIQLERIKEHGEIKVIQSQKRSSKAFYQTYDSIFQSIGYEFLYEQELDTQRISLGLNIPLGSLSSEQERLKAQYLHKNSAYNVQKESTREHIRRTSYLLQLKVEALYDEYMLLRIDILPLNLELVKLSKSAYSEGEGTIMEYLDATRSYSENVLEMLEVKKSYYEELFMLYKKADLELGENHD